VGKEGGEYGLLGGGLLGHGGLLRGLWLWAFWRIEIEGRDGTKDKGKCSTQWEVWIGNLYGSSLANYEIRK
jgi:hypothetical protein